MGVNGAWTASSIPEEEKEEDCVQASASVEEVGVDVDDVDVGGTGGRFQSKLRTITLASALGAYILLCRMQAVSLLQPALTHSFPTTRIHDNHLQAHPVPNLSRLLLPLSTPISAGWIKIVHGLPAKRPNLQSQYPPSSTHLIPRTPLACVVFTRVPWVPVVFVQLRRWTNGLLKSDFGWGGIVERRGCWGNVEGCWE